MPACFDDRHDALFELLIVAVGFEFDDDPAAPLADGERLGQRGHAFRGILRILVAADVDAADASRRCRPRSSSGLPPTFIRSLSCTTSTWPSADSWTSSSMKSVCCSAARRKDASVFSGAIADEPRCAITSAGRWSRFDRNANRPMPTAASSRRPLNPGHHARGKPAWAA